MRHGTAWGVLKHIMQHGRGSLRRAQAFEDSVHGHGDVVDEDDLIRRNTGSSAGMA